MLTGKGTVVVSSAAVSVTVMKLEQSDSRSVNGGSPESLVPVTLSAQACTRVVSLPSSTIPTADYQVRTLLGEQTVRRLTRLIELFASAKPSSYSLPGAGAGAVAASPRAMSAATTVRNFIVENKRVWVCERHAKRVTKDEA